MERASIWSVAFERHEPEILAYLRRRVRRSEDAEDLCQEAFARAVGTETPLRDPSKVRSYLFRIARNLLINHLQRRKLVRSESEFAGDVDLEATTAAGTPGPDAEVRWQDLMGRLRGVLATLPVDQRRAFQLGVLERRPYAEIAAQTGWSLAKVKISVFRARRRLIDELHDQWIE